MKNYVASFLCLALCYTAWTRVAHADPVNATDFANLPEELFNKVPCASGELDEVSRPASQMSIDAFQVSEAKTSAGIQDPSKMKVLAFLADGSTKILTAPVASMDYDPNQNGDPIMHFQITGVADDGQTSLHLYCFRAY